MTLPPSPNPNPNPNRDPNQVETSLSEIVVDDAHRLGCPLGVKLTGRTLTLVADKQRLLTLRVP